MSNWFSLTVYKAYADLRAESEKVYMSYAWWVVEPVLQMVVYYVVFGILLKRGTEGFVTFLLVGLVVWRWFAATLTQGAQSIQANRNIINQVHVPKSIFPSVTLCTQTFKYLVLLTVLLILLGFAGYPPTVHFLFLPVLVVVQLILVAGFAFTLSAIYPFFPDLQLLVSTGLLLMFFLSGIFYAGSSIPEQYQTYFYLNPMAVLIESYRDILLYQKWPSILPLIRVMAMGVIFLALGIWILRRLDGKFAKVMP